jgi:anthranilate phosphoribosyltransferase
MDLKSAIALVSEGRDLSVAQMTDVMQAIMAGAATPAQIGGFLVALRMKGETVAEITAAASVMRTLATPVHVQASHLVDTCGTGGDGAHTFNISTAAAIVVAAAGGHVAKHGNRSVSSKSGSADLLELAGVKIDLDADQVARCIERVGVGFMFAPLHHGTMKHAIGPRRELGIRTIFNVLGPLTNPARAPNQVLGVYSADLVLPIANVLANLGSKHVMVVHAEDGLDEISIGATTHVAELKSGAITQYRIRPEDFGIESKALSHLQAVTSEDSLRIIEQVFANTPGPALDIVALNAGAAIYVAGLAEDLKAGVALARAALASGQVGAKLTELIEFSRQVPGT